MSEKNLINQLIAALQVMPGVGQKSAQRIAFYLLQRDRGGGGGFGQGAHRGDGCGE